MEKDLPEILVYGDGETDDFEALQAHFSGKAKAVHEDGSPFPKMGGKYFVGKTIILGNKKSR